jgi:AcrR family transcriptional regulator
MIVPRGGPGASDFFGNSGRVGFRDAMNHDSIVVMPYRRTDNVVRRLAARHNAILSAALAAASEGGMAAVQIAPVAERAGVAAGTVYRYFPSKTDLVAALVAAISERELGELRKAADAAPGPLSALAAAIATFAARALRDRKLAWAVLAEPVDAEAQALRLEYRKALAEELRARIEAAVAGRLLPEQDARLSAPALVGALLEALVGPLAPETVDDVARARDAVQMVTLLSLRALGVVDARARGLVVQTVLPARGDGTA